MKGLRIVIAGGSGFLGRPLTARLLAHGHDVVILTRGVFSPGPSTARRVVWTPDGSAGDWARAIDGADAVVNLAGEGIADRRWTARRKDALRQSRILSTRSLVAAIRAASNQPPVFLSGSGVGYYGDTGEVTADESSPAGSDFLATLCVAWEREAGAAAALGCRVVIIRTGIVLARDGGALKKLIPPVRLFVGGPIASGQQYMPWIHRDDWIAMAEWAIGTPTVAGPFNGAAPNPVRNAEFMRALGRALHRPSWLPAPTFALRLIVGEIADVALAGGQRAVPKRALELAFPFRYDQVDEAMRAAVSA